MSLLISKISKTLLSSILIFVSCTCAFAQSYNTSSTKAVKYFQKAYQEFLKDNDKALQYVEKALSYDNNFTDAILLKAELYLELSNDTLAIATFEHLFETDSTAFPRSAISLSKLYSKHYQFDKSINLLQWYLSLDNQRESLKEIARKELELNTFRKSLIDNPVDYNPKNIGNTVNSPNDEYVNQYNVIEDKIIFTCRHHDKNSITENIYYTTIMDSVWLYPKQLLDNTFIYGNIGAANVSSDGNTIFYSGNSLTNNHISHDIYYIEFKNGKWSKPINIKAINTSEWESQPCISHDGNELYFVRGSKSGTSDIYVSKRDKDGKWSQGIILNSNINTDGNEMAPFIHHDGKSLYFSSDRHYGMGGYDLFLSRRNENGEWTKSVNLGYPVNTSGDEINIVISNDAKKALISAIRDEGYGAYDIYEFDLDEGFRPEPVDIVVPSDEEMYAATIEKEGSVTLKNIYFKFDSAELTETSDEGITAIFNYLNSYPETDIMLEGHTDDMGNEDYNMTLSKERAESVKEALIERGISAERIKTKGCGSSQPLFPNNFDELRALNRRVSMSLMYKD